MLRGFVKERSLSKCKKFIQNYVDKVIVYKDHVEIFNVVFTMLKDYDFYKIKSFAKKIILFNWCRSIVS